MSSIAADADAVSAAATAAVAAVRAVLVVEEATDVVL